jgi:lipopolysaccharide export LptBFGC system permease protein LptF
MKIVDTKYLFNNLKNGDMVGFHYKPWYYIFAKVIGVFTKNKSRLGIEHIGICYNVKKENNETSFNFGEQLTATGRTNNKIIIKYFAQNYTILKNSKTTSHLFGKNIEFYLLELKHNLTPIQNSTLNTYFNVKEKYSVASAIASVPFFEKIFKIKDKNKDNYCSGAVHTALNSIGIGLNIEDTLPSPAELSTFDYIANIYKITE